MTPAQVHISEPSYQVHCLFFSLALKALLLILWPNYTSSLWLTRPITQKCYSTKQYGAAAHFEAMQLSAEIIVDEEIDKIQRFFYMQCIKIFSKQTHVMFFSEVFSMVYSMHIKPLHAQVDRQTFAITYCMACICKYTCMNFLIAKDTIQTIPAFTAAVQRLDKEKNWLKGRSPRNVQLLYTCVNVMYNNSKRQNNTMKLHFEAMQLSAEITVVEEINEIDWFFYMQCMN